jgi:hypothetical protein
MAQDYVALYGRLPARGDADGRKGKAGSGRHWTRIETGSMGLVHGS